MIVPWLFLVALIFAVLLIRFNAINPEIAKFEKILVLGLAFCAFCVGFVFSSDVSIIIKLIAVLLGWEYLRVLIFVKGRIG